ncbi:MAG: hypothetical protein BAJALOKI1v1_390002 [Promethearchaeota archaeon]|nr:MAG: hypothetical protein BAJALOKI1v1_390002 [Candidatus Lokiarchaeota archaeon]
MPLQKLTTRYSVIIMGIMIFIGLIIPLFHYLQSPRLLHIPFLPNNYEYNEGLSSSQGNLSNSIYLQQALDKKIEDYSMNGYFSSLYESSLQGTYYSLSILESLNKLNTINQTQIENYIMSHYDNNHKLFIDEYAKRYLDTDFELDYYPLSTLLEVNCYALLSLEILNALDTIDAQFFNDFIWSCFDITEGGFIGQPYNNSLHSKFKIATLDNTYFAVQTLDRLMDSWTPYTVEKTQIITFINGLQELNQYQDYYGGFENDNDFSFRSLNMFGPNMLSSYYAVKTLEFFGMWDSINVDAFFQFLQATYFDEANYFECVELAPYTNYSIYAATAMGLDLSLHTSFTEINQTEIIAFLRSHRNDLGLWPSTTSYTFYEMIDTFQIMRSLSQNNLLNEFTPLEKEMIANATELFKTGDGYSFMAHEYTKMSQIYSISHAFDLYDRISELDLQGLYQDLEDAYYDSESSEFRGFYGYSADNGECGLFRLEPIEICNLGTHTRTFFTDYETSHKSTYMALVSLQKLFKLDDFEYYHNLTELVESIERCQINESVSECYGAFVPYEDWKHRPIEHQERVAFLEQTYFALHSIDLLMNYLGVGTIFDSIINISAVDSYIRNNIEETDDYVYYNGFCEDNTIKLKNTFFMAKCLLMFDSFDINLTKLGNFVKHTIEYTNNEALYYAFKLDELLSLGVNFNYTLSQSLVKDLYREDLAEFQISKNRTSIFHESLYWNCYMSKYSRLKLSAQYEGNVKFGTYNNMTVDLCNMIISNFSNEVSVTFENPELGINTFTKRINGSYLLSLFIPREPQYIPIIEGFIRVYKNLQLLKQHYVNFSVYSDSTIQLDITTLEDVIFLSEGNMLEFYISTNFPDYYELFINSEIVKNETYANSTLISYSLDAYSNQLGSHSLEIRAYSQDGKSTFYNTDFEVYSNSTTEIHVLTLEDVRFLSQENLFEFKINTNYPDYYELYIDMELVENTTYLSNKTISYSLDQYSQILGSHSLKLNAYSIDEKNTSFYSGFEVYSDSITEIELIHLEDIIFLSEGNSLEFKINTQYPDYYEMYIEEVLVKNATYLSDTTFSYSLDQYSDQLGTYSIELIAYALDGKNGTFETEFEVFSTSDLFITLHNLPSYVYNSTEEWAIFSITSDYPEYYWISIDGEQLYSDHYNPSENISFLMPELSPGIHTFLIEANATDGDYVFYSCDFYVFLDSFVSIDITYLKGYEVFSMGNLLNFSVESSSPGNVSLYIDGEFIAQWTFEKYIQGGYSFIQYIDGYLAGNHTVLLEAVSEDGKNALNSAQFMVYSTSTTVVNIIDLPNYEFLEEDKKVRFNVSSLYEGNYSLYINGIMVNYSDFLPNAEIFVSIEGYSIGNHTVKIVAWTIDGLEGYVQEMFTVYTSSTTQIVIDQLESFSFLSEHNYLNFSCYSSYEMNYTLFIDGMLLQEGQCSSGETVWYNLDGYNHQLGVHNLSLFAIAQDGLNATLNTSFSVYSNSVLSIEIHHLDNIVFLSSGNLLNFSVITEYPDYFELYIDGNLYSNNSDTLNYYIYSLDDLADQLGLHFIEIKAYALDGDYAEYATNVSVYSLSSLSIEIHSLENIIFLSTSNILNFSMITEYPDYFELYIDNILSVNSSEDLEHIICDLDEISDDLGLHSIKIYAYALDGDYAEYATNISVYSTSILHIEINRLENIEFLSSENIINFSLQTQYPYYYELYIDEILNVNDTYTDNPIIHNLDELSDNIGMHSIIIHAYALDGDEVIYSTNISVYSDSTIELNINCSEQYGYTEGGYPLNISINSQYDGNFSIFLNTSEICSGNFEAHGDHFFIELSNLTIGEYLLEVYANAIDGNGNFSSHSFSISSTSNTFIQILHFDSEFEVNTTGNYLSIQLSSLYPKHINVSINNQKVYSNNFLHGEIVIVPLDNYEIGMHSILLTITSRDGAELIIQKTFSVIEKTQTKINFPSLPLINNNRDLSEMQFDFRLLSTLIPLILLPTVIILYTVLKKKRTSKIS